MCSFSLGTLALEKLLLLFTFTLIISKNSKQGNKYLKYILFL